MPHPQTAPNHKTQGPLEPAAGQRVPKLPCTGLNMYLGKDLPVLSPPFQHASSEVSPREQLIAFFSPGSSLHHKTQKLLEPPAGKRVPRLSLTPPACGETWKDSP